MLWNFLSFQNNWKIALEIMLVLGLHAQFFLLIMPAVWPCMRTNTSEMKNNETQKVRNYVPSPCYFSYIGSSLSNINSSNMNCSQFLKTVKKLIIVKETVPWTDMERREKQSSSEKRKSTPPLKLVSYNSQCWHLMLVLLLDMPHMTQCKKQGI